MRTPEQSRVYIANLRATNPRFAANQKLTARAGDRARRAIANKYREEYEAEYARILAELRKESE